MAGSLTEGTPKGVPYDHNEGAPYVMRRTVEIWTAAAIALVGAVVISESLTHDIGWNETGPGSGYFPFRVGLLLIAAAVVRLLQVRLKADTTSVMKVDTTTAFVTRAELSRSLSVLWPTMALVVAMIPLGCYVPSAAYLTWMMRRHGGYSWLLSAAYGAGVAVAFFLVFDLWFRVPLAKGPLEAALGLY
ncbi:MAG TPA: tripartite tricarboxylate transporter TctB family protein [Vicinamibacterales bacterium]|nr:tripartite tricarboxylate transporter TctB family protein [Vicinamibacterales bacterium]